tara:strand:- start:827 stop:1459 length:633 start_codon:yes stop_codon:yes gene_type:complete
MQMPDVLVSYYSGQFGDWLRYFIAEHDGFEKFTGVTTDINEDRGDPPYANFSFDNMKRISVSHMGSVDELYSKMIKSDLRQVYKVSGISHSIAYNPDNYGAEWDWKYYNVIRQTNMNIIFVKLNPLHELFETYVKRKELHGVPPQHLLRENNHKSFIYNEYPKHELNYVLEINNLLDHDEKEYENLTKFLQVKPISDWKKYLKKLESVIL